MPGRQELSFDIKTANDFFAKLRQEQLALEADFTSSRHAINAAMTAYHMYEWVWGLSVKRSSAIQNSLSITTRDEFRNYCLRHCPELETMQCVCEGSKHLGTTGKNVESTEIKGGAFDSSFDKSVDVSRLQVNKSDGTTVYFDDELACVLSFWDAFFSRHILA